MSRRIDKDSLEWHHSDEIRLDWSYVHKPSMKQRNKKPRRPGAGRSTGAREPETGAGSLKGSSSKLYANKVGPDNSLEGFLVSMR